MYLANSNVKHWPPAPATQNPKPRITVPRNRTPHDPTIPIPLYEPYHTPPFSHFRMARTPWHSTPACPNSHARSTSASSALRAQWANAENRMTRRNSVESKQGLHTEGAAISRPVSPLVTHFKSLCARHFSIRTRDQRCSSVRGGEPGVA